jgi:hypothetical protein
MPLGELAMLWSLTVWFLLGVHLLPLPSTLSPVEVGVPGAGLRRPPEGVRCLRSCRMRYVVVRYEE